MAVLGGKISADFSIETSTVSVPTNVAINASQSVYSAHTFLQVLPPTHAGYTFSPQLVAGGQPSVGTMIFDAPVPAGGALLSVDWSSNLLSGPNLIQVKAGADSVSFTVTPDPVATNTTIVCTAGFAVLNKSANLYIKPPALVGLTLAHSQVAGGATVVAKVPLDGGGISGGTTIQLTSDSNDAAVPKSVVVPYGATFATFTIDTVTVSKSVLAHIQAKLGNVAETANLTINRAALASLSLSQTSVVGSSRTAVNGLVTLDGHPAQPYAKVLLSSSNPAVASVPAFIGMSPFHLTHISLSR